ncbi:ABC transporter ATP-binding protein [Lichenifustis flavocetrariae]|uniref:ABC transporter ATP-binding protein n=1 Tax=Lichenifustis flavocetrariae TaxID=2949735 RepID=A0AA41Z4W6_9HYPH|nr:ABC transporter ATP-binding protein [Lichenifustis flavocetrariae]MCW6510523.1 ABC transporter ATP-binding protein [Lichenifustis flavocetrariae]
MTVPLLEVRDLSVTFRTEGVVTQAVRNVSFVLGRERLGIVGESGSGKSTTGRAVLGLVPAHGSVSASRLALNGEDLRHLTQHQWSRYRGRRMALVMQDPKFSLNPIMTVEKQITEAWRLHRRTTAAEARKHAAAMLEAVSIDDPERVLRLYPHQLSGGMGQRVMIAAMLIAEPELLIADEAISALDVTVGNEVLAILDRLVAERGMGLIFISHNLTAVAGLCDRVVVMYGGRVVEECAARDLAHARHPYTRALLAAAPSLDEPRASLASVVRDPAWLT